MAGGGVREDQTDDLRYFVVEKPVTIRDLHATILHLFGFDPYQFAFPFQGLPQRLIGASDETWVIEDLLV